MSAFMHFITSEWYFAVPMFLMSFTAVTLVVWRVLLNLDAKTDLNLFLPKFQKVLAEDGPEAALAFCKAQKGVIAKKLFPAGLETQPQGAAAMRRAMASTIELEIVPDLNFLLALILAIAKIATMVGLLGTVISMINTFSAISAEQNATGVASHSKEIGLALFATALGLITAIPLVFSHVLFKDWIARYELKMQSAAQKLLVMVQNKGATLARPAIPSVSTARVG
ncbi:MAG TPA: MotA/TolQ/ExbB proton channel family protein [Gemmataceae bacterium]|jgi:biopolymer transport protein ExbB|nr:MotA/TolQ/ExbB proton channel family protein [Gemmataceae bacterium]